MFGMKKKIYLIFGDVDGQSFHKYFYGYPTECIKEKRILSEELTKLFDTNNVNIYDEAIEDTTFFKQNDLKIIKTDVDGK